MEFGKPSSSDARIYRAPPYVGITARTTVDRFAEIGMSVLATLAIVALVWGLLDPAVYRFTSY